MVLPVKRDYLIFLAFFDIFFNNMYCGNSQNEIKKKFKYIVILRNVFYMLHNKVPNLPRSTENNKGIN